MASIDSLESDQEVSTSHNSDKFESMLSELDRKLTSFDSVHSDLLKKLAFYERENRERSFDRKPEEEREERRDEKRSHQRSDGRGRERSESKGEKNDGCFKCGKPGHFASECYSKDSRPKPQKDAA